MVVVVAVEGGGELSRALPEPHEAGPPRVASGAWQGFREVGRRAGWQPVPGAEAAGGSRHSEALPEWTEIFSSAHKGHFSLPQQSHSDRECVCVRRMDCVLTIHVGRVESGAS